MMEVMKIRLESGTLICDILTSLHDATVHGSVVLRILQAWPTVVRSISETCVFEDAMRCATTAAAVFASIHREDEDVSLV